MRLDQISTGNRFYDLMLAIGITVVGSINIFAKSSKTEDTKDIYIQGNVIEARYVPSSYRITIRTDEGKLIGLDVRDSENFSKDSLNKMIQSGDRIRLKDSSVISDLINAGNIEILDSN